MIDPAEFAQLNANAHANYDTLAARAAAAKPQPKAKGNFLTHLFPTIGGIGGGVVGGAAGGALAGSAVLPGVGTAVGGLLGALIGGTVGGGAGKVTENKLEGQSLGSGVLPTAWNHPGAALEQGVLSAGPLRLLKGIGVAGKAAVGSGSLLDALGQGGAVNATVDGPGLLVKGRAFFANKGAQTEARAGGFGIGEKVPGSEPLGFYDSAKITKNLKAEGIKAGSPETRLKQVEDALAARGQEIDTHLATNNKVLTPTAKQSIADNFMKSVDQQPGVDDLVRKKAADLASNFVKQTSDTKSVVNFRRGLDKQVINFNQNPSAALAAKQLAARTFRDVLSDTTENLAPGLKQANQSYSKLKQAQEFLTGANKAVSDQSQGGGGLVSRALTNDTAQATKSRIGSVTQKIGPRPNSGANPFGAIAIGGRQLPIGVAGALGTGAAQPSNNTNITTATMPNGNSSNPSLTNSMNSNINPSMDTLSQNNGDMSSSSVFDPANLETNIQKIVANGGNLKDIEDYVSLASSINSLHAASTKANASTTIKPTGQQYGLATGGLNSLQQLQQLLSGNPSLAARNQTPGQGLPLVGNLITNLAGAGDYHALADNVLQSLIHLQTGATATPEEVKAARGQLPGPSDTPEEVQRKLSNLSAMFAPYVQGGTIGGSSDISDLLSALGAQ